MKLFALFALLATSSAITIPEDNELLFCAQDTEGWGRDLPGLYDGSSVISLDGDKALNELIFGKSVLKNGKPDLVVAYHPQCPHCHTMVQDFKKLAQLAKDKNAAVNIVGVNMSKTDPELFDIEGIPSIRLYKGPNKFDEYKSNRTFDGFKKFLETEGIKL